jgi:hypothetical protein
MSQPVEQPSRIARSSRPGSTPAVATTPASAPEPVAAPTTPEPQPPTVTRRPPAAAQPQETSKRRLRTSKRRHARVVIRKVAPWSVFKVSLIFYTCVMLVILGAMVILYGVLGAIGALDSVTDLIRDLFADQAFTISGRWLFTRGLGVGIAMVVIWSLINVFVVFLYNLISDLVGGVEVTLAERR